MWQPIETAPKNATWVILRFRNDSAIAPEPVISAGFWSTWYDDWYASEAASHSLTEVHGSPTHWMLLVEPVNE
jgi:hypothetical protein